MRARTTATLAIAALGGLALAACGTLDSAGLVHDLRLLAIRADPADQVFQIPLDPQSGGLFLDDGGISPAAAAALATIQVKPITVTALVADPHGAGRAIHYQYSVCAVLDDDGRCDPSAPQSQVLDEGLFTPDGGWGELRTTFTPSLALLGTAVQRDAYHGFDFLPVPVQLALTTPDDEVVGIKRLVFTVVFQGQAVPTPNQNPFLPAVDLDGQVWSASAAPTLPGRRGYEVAPVIPTAAEETYTREKFDGSALTFQESWRDDFFATAGGWSSLSGGGQSNLTGNAAPTDSTWTPKADDGPQPVTFFVVVRDGRGGTGWAVRSALFAPPDAGP